MYIYKSKHLIYSINNLTLLDNQLLNLILSSKKDANEEIIISVADVTAALTATREDITISLNNLTTKVIELQKRFEPTLKALEYAEIKDDTITCRLTKDMQELTTTNNITGRYLAFKLSTLLKLNTAESLALYQELQDLIAGAGLYVKAAIRKVGMHSLRQIFNREPKEEEVLEVLNTITAKTNLRVELKFYGSKFMEVLIVDKCVYPCYAWACI